MIWTGRIRATERKESATATDQIEHKDLESFEIKDEAKGEVSAIVATIGVVDKDGDIIAPGAIKSGSRVVISGYGHNAMFGDRPVGKGVITIQDNKAVLNGQIFMDTADGRDTFAVLKGMGADQEWSFGFRVVGSEVPDDAAQKKGARRILTKLTTVEASPVLVGAGIGTRTISAKAKEEEPAPAPAAEPETETEEAKAAREALEKKALEDARELKARADATDCFEHFQRTGRRLGVR